MAYNIQANGPDQEPVHTPEDPGVQGAPLGPETAPATEEGFEPDQGEDAGVTEDDYEDN